MFDHKGNLVATALGTAATGLYLLVACYTIDGVFYLMDKHSNSN